MAATATKNKPASKSSSSSKTKSTARGVTKSTAKPKSPAVKDAEQLREKRAAMEQPVVDTPIPVEDTTGETRDVDGKNEITVTAEGSSATVTLGGKSVTLDREGLLSLQRHVQRIAAGF